VNESLDDLDDTSEFPLPCARRMKSTLCVAIGMAIWLCSPDARADVWQPSPGHTQLALWPGDPPDAPAVPGPAETVDASGRAGGRPFVSVMHVSRPTLTVYAPKAHNTGAAVVVFPGGGYIGLAIDLEGTEVCDWLTGKGITCIVLKYRVPFSGPHWDPDCKCHRDPPHPYALQDAQRALGLVRAHAAAWHIDPHKIGVLGFSAGGHLVAMTSTHFAHRAYPAVDAADQLSCRPDFAIALYPGHLWIDEDKLELDPEIAGAITAQTSPTLLVHAENDDVDDIKHSLVYYLALKQAGVPVEIHSYAQGGHAFGLRSSLPISAWPRLVETWLETLGMIAK
jgi:acetyl esterase/lipase